MCTTDSWIRSCLITKKKLLKILSHWPCHCTKYANMKGWISAWYSTSVISPWKYTIVSCCKWGANCWPAILSANWKIHQSSKWTIPNRVNQTIHIRRMTICRISLYSYQNHGCYTELIEGRILDKGYKAVSCNNSADKKCNVLQCNIWDVIFVNRIWVHSHWQ